MKFCLGAILILNLLVVSCRTIPLETGPSNGETDPQWNSSWADRFWVPEVSKISKKQIRRKIDLKVSQQYAILPLFISSAVVVFGTMIMDTA